MIRLELTGETVADIREKVEQLFGVAVPAELKSLETDDVFLAKLTADREAIVAEKQAALKACETWKARCLAAEDENGLLKLALDKTKERGLELEALLRAHGAKPDSPKQSPVPPPKSPDEGPATLHDIPQDAPIREALSSTELRGLLGDLRDKCGKDALTAVLSKFGVVQFSKIEPKDYLAVEDEARALLAGNT